MAADALWPLLAQAAPGRLVVLLGGEPLLRRDLPRLLAMIRAAGGVPGLVTTGRALVYPKWRERLRRAGVEYLRVQLFGVGEAHDRATATAGAYAQTIAGLQAWQREGAGACDVDVALSTRGADLDQLLPALRQLAADLEPAEAAIVVAVDPGDPAAGAAIRRGAAALADWNADESRPLLVWEVAADGLAELSLRIAPPRPVFIGPAPPATCLGASAALARAGAPADARPRANSFNYVRSGLSVAATDRAATCDAYAKGAGIDPLRQLWLIEGDRLLQHVTDTGDFDDREIAAVKDRSSHLFFDRAAPGTLDDISEGMRRILPDPLCGSCIQRAGCGRRFRLVEEAPFARQEAWIGHYVAGLCGEVLDVGCGEQPYGEVLAPLLRSGVVRYTGLDPDQRSLERARAALPGGRFQLGGIEDFTAPRGRYDHLLCLRSLNHVFDLDEAFARMAWLLKPGGALLMVETTPFAMVRRPEQVAAADRAPRAGHQHFRNVASDEVLPFVRRHRMRVVTHEPSSFASTNQWILVLERV